MASQVNPLVAGNTTDDSRFNYRFGLLAGGPGGLATYPSIGGPPANSVGNDGDFAQRRDGGAGTTLYQHRAGAWVATGA